MGMQAMLEQITPQKLAEFIEHPKKAYDYWLAEALDNPNLEPFLAQISDKLQELPPAFRAQVEQVTGRLYSKMQEHRGLHLVTKEQEPEPPRKRFSLEKDWHVLHYVLNGTTEGGEGPLADAVLGGEQIPDEEEVSDFGGIRYLSPQRVAMIAQALAAVDPDQLLSKLDRKDAEAKCIYLSHTLPDGWEYLPELFRNFRAFYEDAARSGNAMLLSIS
ncbi:MAG TPA: YfbM family protein [Dongiaceae bacterium]|nr:YfbM family protein [Dongiaceae bacterium]